MGYKQKNWGVLKDVAIQVNVTNLANTKYYSTIGSNGFVASDPKGNSQLC